MDNIGSFNEQWATNSNVKLETFMVDDKIIAVSNDSGDDKYHSVE